MTESSKPPENHERPLRLPALLRMLGRASLHAYTHLRTTRNRPLPLFGIIENELADFPQPLQPDIPTIVENTKAVLAKYAIQKPDRLSLSDKLMYSARMVQFTDRFASTEEAFIDYPTIEELKNRFVASAQEQCHPLAFDQQLDIALQLSNKDILQALTNLWITSRQYARWFDSVSIRDLPDFTPEEIMTRMKEWRSSILGCKNAEGDDFQDVEGDTYYVWTHAIARFIYGGTSTADRLGMYIFSHGTDINTRIQSFNFLRQSIKSNHQRAARYGNSIGAVLLDAEQQR